MVARLADLDADLDAARVEAVLADRAEARDMRRAAARARDQVADLDLARAAFAAFAIPEGGRAPVPADVAGYLRVMLFGAGVRLDGVAALLDGGDDFNLPEQTGGYILTGRRRLSRSEWSRIRTLVACLEEDQAERARAAHEAGPRDGIGADALAILHTRLGRPLPGPRYRAAVNPEILGLAMTTALREEKLLLGRRESLAHLVKALARATEALFRP